MANFRTTTNQTNFDARTFATDVANARNRQRESYSGNGTFSQIGGYDVVGINTKGIPEIRLAIKNYVQKIEDHLSRIKVTADPTIALKGTGMEDAVRQYISKVVDYCTSLCTNLLAFNDKLAKVEEAWQTSDVNMASNVNGATGDLSSAASQRYTEKF